MNTLKITPLSFYVRLQTTYHFRVMNQQDFVATNRACRYLIRVYDQENATERYSDQGSYNVARNLLLYLHHTCGSFFLCSLQLRCHSSKTSFLSHKQLLESSYFKEYLLTIAYIVKGKFSLQIL
jgi:hypothetical protein